MVDFYKGEYKKFEFIVGKNYLGMLLVLEFDDGICIVECMVIIEYFDVFDGVFMFIGSMFCEKGIIYMMSKCVELELFDVVSVYFYYGMLGFGFDVEMY